MPPKKRLKAETGAAADDARETDSAGDGSSSTSSQHAAETPQAEQEFDEASIELVTPFILPVAAAPRLSELWQRLRYAEPFCNGLSLVLALVKIYRVFRSCDA